MSSALVVKSEKKRSNNENFYISSPITENFAYTKEILLPTSTMHKRPA